MDASLATALEIPLRTYLDQSIYLAGTSLVSKPPLCFSFLTRSQAHIDDGNISHVDLCNVLTETRPYLLCAIQSNPCLLERE